MPLLISLIVSVAMLISVHVNHGGGGAAGDRDLAKFQGTWRIVSVECGGKSDNQDIDNYTIRFHGNAMIVRKRGGIGARDDGEGDEATVEFDLRHDCGQCLKRIAFGGISGIYDFKNGNLRICYSLDGDEPAEFRTTVDRPDEVLMILMRVDLR